MRCCGVVEHVVHINVDVVLAGLVDEFFKVGLRAQMRVDGAVVQDIVVVVRCRSLHGREPQGGGAKGIQIVKMLSNAAKVPPAVTVRVGKAVHIELICYAGELVGAWQRPRVGTARRTGPKEHSQYGQGGEYKLSHNKQYG